MTTRWNAVIAALAYAAAMCALGAGGAVAGDDAKPDTSAAPPEASSSPSSAGPKDETAGATQAPGAAADEKPGAGTEDQAEEATPPADQATEPDSAAADDEDAGDAGKADAEDTGADAAAELEEQSLFVHSLGPDGDNAFKHDGGETIFSLPNGFEAYYLNTAKGVWLDKGPTETVLDDSQLDRAVTNGTPASVATTRGFARRPTTSATMC
jgi:hypothetical protein